MVIIGSQDSASTTYSDVRCELFLTGLREGMEGDTPGKRAAEGARGSCCMDEEQSSQFL